MNLNESSSAYAGSSMVRTIASFGSNTYNFTTYSDTIISRIISGTGTGILKNGSGTLTLSAANTYTGNVTISAGVLSIINVNALQGYNTNGRFAVAPNATLAVYNAVTDAEVLTLRNTTNFRANSNIGFDTTSGNRTYTPTIGNTSQGALGLAKLGQNTLIIPTTNSYTGSTSVLVGTLSTFGANRIPDSSPVFIDSGATLVLGGSDTLATISGRGTLNCQNNNITLNSNNNSTFSGVLTSIASGNWSIFKQGTNTITLSGATVRVSGTGSVVRLETGRMNLVGNTSFIQNRTSNSPRNFQIALNGGTTFNLTISGGASLTTAGFMFGENNGGSGTVNLLSGGTWNSGGGGGQTWMSGLSSILNIDGGAYSALSFYIGGGAAGTTSIINLNSGTANLSGGIFIWQGGGRCVFNLNGGTVTFGSMSNGAVTDNTFNFNGGTFACAVGGYNYNIGVVKYIVKSGGAIFNTPAGGSITLTTSVLSADSVSTGGGLVKNGAGTLFLGSVLNTFTGQVSANEGTISVTTVNNNSTNGPLGNNTFPVILGGNGKSGTLSYTGSTTTSNKPFKLASGGTGIIDVTTAGTTYASTGIIDGSGSLTKNGAGTLNLSANNTFSGNSVLNAGALIVASNSALGTGNNINLNGAQISSDTTASRTLSNNTVSLSSNTTFPTIANEKSLTFTGTTTMFGATHTLTVQTGSTVTSEYINFAGPIGDNGNGYGLIKAGNGTLVLSGINTYSGNTTINAGNLRMLYLPVGEIRFGGGTLQYQTDITTDLSSRIRNNTNAVRVDTNGQTVVFESLSSSNTGGLLKIGTGTLILTGSNNTYMSNNGTTVSNVGTLTYAGTHRTPAAIQISNATSVTTGVITISGSLTQTSSPAGTRTFTIAEAPNAIGTLNIVSGATVELSGGMMMGGNNTNPVGILNMFGGSLNTKGALWSCGNSVVNIYNGTIFGGSIYHGGGSSSPNTNMTSTINISGGSAIIDQFNLGFGQLSGTNTITNLVSGTLSVNDVNTNSRPNNTHVFYFNGGILNIRVTSTFPTVNSIVRSGGAIIDVTGTITTSSIFSDGGGGGGFTKLGSGLFGFNAINTYTGTTNISAGTLRVLKKISGTGSDASFSQANFTPTTLSVTFVSGTPPSVGNTYKLFSGSTQQTYASVTLVNYSGTASYDSATSTLTINS
jgi:fibronectin-binding autotransporter adhesin